MVTEKQEKEKPVSESAENSKPSKRGSGKTAARPPLLLVDGSSYLFRAYHALPPLTASDGHPTGAIRGVIAMIKKLQKDYARSPVAVIFDPKGKTFRDELYPEYKANRPPMPDELRDQIQPIHDIIRALGLPLIVVDGVEADDVIGTLAQQATQQQRDTVISTGDKDMAQLVTEHVTLVNTMNDTRLDRAGVIEKFGVPPERIIDYLALMGDSVDNIPGVAKVGPKTAAKWLTAYDSLDGVMASADEIKGKVGENLRAALEHLPLSRTLTTIKCDVDLPFTLEELTAGEPAVATLRELYDRFEFKAWLEELGAPPEPELERPLGDYQCLTEPAELERWVERLSAADVIAFDTETNSLNYMDAELVGFSFALEPGVAAYVPVGHSYVGVPAQLPLTRVLKALRPVLEAEKPLKVGQNLKYDISVLARYDVHVAGIAHDTMLQSYVLDSTATRHNMDALARTYLQRGTIKYEDIAGKGAKQLTFDQIPLEQACEYAAEDADVTLQLHERMWPALAELEGPAEVYRTIEMPLVPVLSSIERHGTLVDGGLLDEQSRELTERLAELTETAWSLAGEEFNLDSPKQLQRIFFEKLELPVLKKTPGGQPSTAEVVLQDMAHDFELPRVILDYRQLAKLKSTYTDKLPQQINQRTGRIHTSYHQAVTATGRLSSSDPNLQNIPIRTAEGRRVRQAFVAPPGMCMVAADYSQIELRIMAHLSGDEGLLSAFAAGQDIHRATAAEVFGTTPDAVTDDERRSAKAINFRSHLWHECFWPGKTASHIAYAG